MGYLGDIMKIVFSFLVLALSLNASAIELSAASNHQILQELSSRLENGGGGGVAPVIVTYLCDNNGYLKIETLTSTGESKADSKYLSTPAQCEEQANRLRQTKSKAYGLMLYALCDNNGYLSKNTINEKGEMKTISTVYLSSYQACLPQAKSINAQP